MKYKILMINLFAFIGSISGALWGMQVASIKDYHYHQFISNMLPRIHEESYNLHTLSTVAQEISPALFGKLDEHIGALAGRPGCTQHNLFCIINTTKTEQVCFGVGNIASTEIKTENIIGASYLKCKDWNAVSFKELIPSDCSIVRNKEEMSFLKMRGMIFGQQITKNLTGDVLREYCSKRGDDDKLYRKYLKESALPGAWKEVDLSPEKKSIISEWNIKIQNNKLSSDSELSLQQYDNLMKIMVVLTGLKVLNMLNEPVTLETIKNLLKDEKLDFSLEFQSMVSTSIDDCKNFLQQKEEEKKEKRNEKLILPQQEIKPNGHTAVNDSTKKQTTPKADNLTTSGDTMFKSIQTHFTQYAKAYKMTAGIATFLLSCICILRHLGYSLEDMHGITPRGLQ